VTPDIDSYRHAIEAWGVIGRLDEVERLLEEMKEEGIALDSGTLQSLIHSCLISTVTSKLRGKGQNSGAMRKAEQYLAQLEDLCGMENVHMKHYAQVMELCRLQGFEDRVEYWRERLVQRGESGVYSKVGLYGSRNDDEEKHTMHVTDKFSTAELEPVEVEVAEIDEGEGMLRLA